MRPATWPENVAVVPLEHDGGDQDPDGHAEDVYEPHAREDDESLRGGRVDWRVLADGRADAVQALPRDERAGGAPVSPKDGHRGVAERGP